MKIRINRLFNVVDAQGEKVDEGTLQRYLGEIVWYPSGALSPYITWKEISPGIVEATMEYNGTKGSGKFFFVSRESFINSLLCDIREMILIPLGENG